MRQNLGREGRDPEELGQCPNYERNFILKASIGSQKISCLFVCFHTRSPGAGIIGSQRESPSCESWSYRLTEMARMQIYRRTSLNALVKGLVPPPPFFFINWSRNLHAPPMVADGSEAGYCFHLLFWSRRLACSTHGGGRKRR